MSQTIKLRRQEILTDERNSQIAGRVAFRVGYRAEHVYLWCAVI